MAVKDEKTIQMAEMLYERASYAYTLNSILMVTFNENAKRINEWIGDNEDKGTFIQEYQRVLVRVLLSEVCVIFEEGLRDIKKKYSLKSMLSRIDSLKAQQKDIYLNKMCLADLDCDKFIYINNALIKSGAFGYREISDLLRIEYEKFIEKKNDSIKHLREIRDGYLAHPDLRHQKVELKLACLIPLVEWSFSFVSLILHLLLAHGNGTRPFVKQERQGFYEQIQKQQNNALKAILQ